MIFLGGLAYLGLLSFCVSAMELPLEQSPKRHKQEQVFVNSVPTLKARVLEFLVDNLDKALTAKRCDQSFSKIDSERLFKDFCIDQLPQELRTDLLRAVLKCTKLKIYSKAAPIIGFSPTGHKGLFRCKKHKGLYVEDLFSVEPQRIPSIDACCFASCSKRFAMLSPEGRALFVWRKGQRSKNTATDPVPIIIDLSSKDMYTLPLETLGQYDTYGAFIEDTVFVARTHKVLYELSLRDKALVARKIYTLSGDDIYPINEVQTCVAALDEKNIAVLSPERDSVQLFSKDDSEWRLNKSISLPDKFGAFCSLWGKCSIIWEGTKEFQIIDVVSGKAIQYDSQSCLYVWSRAMGDSGAWLKNVISESNFDLNAIEPSEAACCAIDLKGITGTSRSTLCYHSALYYFLACYCASLQS